jgi:hypothetical protein
MEEITAWPIDLAITVEPEANAWKAGSVVNGKLKDDPREMIHLGSSVDAPGEARAILVF